MLPSPARTIGRSISLGIATLGLTFFGSLCPVRILAENIYPEIPGTDEPGFLKIFDGMTLKDWDGDPRYWRVENGCIVGEVTPQTLLKQNTFIIWRGGVTRDFEIKVEYRISAQGNSGINYRSTDVEGTSYAMRGYQFDLDGEDRN
ncbi:MAG TPA: DUF1080 domain-containing protein, partial [Opitutaceae bacterium]|nr:DUF1080 domain-containing protein [Opitutaceae bacterium]